MFRVNETKNGRGELTVSNGRMILHVTLAGKKILYLYAGKAEKARSDEKNWLKASADTVKYDDGSEDTVAGFDIPVPVIGEDFDLALAGTKGVWYDHRVSVSQVE